MGVIEAMNGPGSVPGDYNSFVVWCGRDGMRFEARELREMMKLEGVAMLLPPSRGNPALEVEKQEQEPTRQQKRLFDLFRKDSETQLTEDDKDVRAA